MRTTKTVTWYLMTRLVTDLLIDASDRFVGGYLAVTKAPIR